VRKHRCVLALVAAAALSAAQAADFASAWPPDAERVWLGRDYWANRLQDWRVASGRIECITSGGNRNVHLLTRELGPGRGGFEMSVRLGRLGEGKLSPGWAGFRIGIKAAAFDDYRSRVSRGRGLDAGVTTGGRLFVGSPGKPADAEPVPLDDLELRLTAKPKTVGYALTLAAHDPKSGARLAVASTSISQEAALRGGVALVCDYRPSLGGRAAAKGKGRPRRGGQRAGGNVRFWFRDWKLSGPKVLAHDDHAFGPVFWAQHTLSNGVLNMTAMLPPIGEKDPQTVRLQVKKGGDWATIATAPIHKLARTATFRVAGWDASKDTPYRVAYTLDGREHTWGGTIRKDPVGKNPIVVAAFTGNADYTFPHNDLVARVKAHDPDVLFFSGDQIYENVGGYGVERRPLDRACLDYLRKWWFFGWAFGDLMRDRPTITIPDDHDVYQGNLWGQGGRKCPGGINTGGYAMDPQWVKMVERTQTSNLPDPFDPTPIGQGIGVYYTAMTYGRVSFAIIEDRKFKTGPEGVVPRTKGRSDHVTDPNFDPRTADVPGAKLLGDRQLKFLRQWAADWRGADFKCALSQTTFCNVATLHGGGLRRLVADYDSNGWPQTGRNKALAELRRGFAFHICGDQHLATIVHHGIDDWGDAIWAFCVPSICNFYPRAWAPLRPARNWRKGMIEHTGQHLDGFGNRITVWAHTNPRPMGHEPAWLHDKMPGYGIVRFDKAARTITMECWPRFADPSASLGPGPRDPKTGGQYEGWPKTIPQLDNYARRPAAWLPTIEVEGMKDPVVQVIDEAGGEVVYTLRIKGTRFRPMVFREGVYTVKVGEQGTPRMKTLTGVRAAKGEGAKAIRVKF